MTQIDVMRIRPAHKAAAKVQAIQEGRQRSQLWWEKRAIVMAKGGAGNTQIVMLGLRNRSRAANGWNNESMKTRALGA
jgi:hypothetical protein